MSVEKGNPPDITKFMYKIPCQTFKARSPFSMTRGELTYIPKVPHTYTCIYSCLIMVKTKNRFKQHTSTFFYDFIWIYITIKTIWKKTISTSSTESLVRNSDFSFIWGADTCITNTIKRNSYKSCRKHDSMAHIQHLVHHVQKEKKEEVHGPYHSNEDLAPQIRAKICNWRCFPLQKCMYIY